METRRALAEGLWATCRLTGRVILCFACSTVRQQAIRRAPRMLRTRPRPLLFATRSVEWKRSSTDRDKQVSAAELDIERNVW